MCSDRSNFGFTALVTLKVMAATKKTGLVFIVLFMLPFCGVGLFCLGLAFRELLSLQPEIDTVLFLGLFGLVFGGVGVWMIFRAFKGYKSSQQVDERKIRHPDKPWLWREDWASGLIRDSNRSSLSYVWFFAVLWNLISAPLSMVLPREILQDRNYPALVGLLFPLAGAGLLIWVIRATLRWKKFGTSVLELETLPGVTGGHLKGILQTPTPLFAEEGLSLKLTCIHRTVSGSGKNRSVNEKILWREGQVFSKERIEARAQGSSIPFTFGIPYDAKETDRKDMDNATLWYVDAAASVPGVDYGAQFEVPLFRTSQSDPDFAPARTAEIPEQTAEDPTHTGSHGGITVRPGQRGGTEVYFAPVRNVSVAIALTLFTSIWSAVIWFMMTQGAPIFFPIIFGLFDLLLLYAVLQLWFGVSKVLIESGQVQVTSGFLWLGVSKVIPCSQVEDIQISIGMQSGGRTGTPYYNIELLTNDKKKVNLGRSIKDKRQAEWLATTLKDAVNQWQ
jgi:hypothetical protein